MQRGTTGEDFEALCTRWLLEGGITRADVSLAVFNASFSQLLVEFNTYVCSIYLPACGFFHLPMRVLCLMNYQLNVTRVNELVIDF